MVGKVSCFSSRKDLSIFVSLKEGICIMGEKEKRKCKREKGMGKK